MSFSHHAWAQRNLDTWLDKYDAANEDEHGRLEHEIPAPVPIRPIDLRSVAVRRPHDRLTTEREEAA